jgi:peptidoglycan/LPS O-acetylase OafA/YrhL
MTAAPQAISIIPSLKAKPSPTAALSPTPARSTDAAKRFYYPELDAIRLFLFCGVWSYHVLPRQGSEYTARHIPGALASTITGLIKAGMCSLDVFFILSAFLITELLLRERDLRGEPDLKAFYIRRLLRIWPLYFFMIAIAALLALFDRNQAFGWAYAISFLLFAGNWMMVFRGFPQASIIGPLWSVSFEEQFYLFWPLVLRRASRRTICGIAIGLLVLANFSRLFLLMRHEGGDPLWYNSFARLDSIVCGIVLAVVLHGRTTLRIGRPARLALFLAGSFAWLIVGNFCGLLDPFPSVMGGMIGYPLMSLGGAAIFLSVLGAAEDGAAFLKNSALVYLGKISYGLYAFHILAERLTDYLLHGHHQRHGWALSWFCALVITFALALASFRWLESPFLRLKRKSFTYIPSGAAS